MENEIKHKNLLVFYKGGGYDGCIWEYNYFFYDTQGKIHNIYKSGSMGLDNPSIEYLNENEYNDYDVFDLNKELDVDNFTKKMPISSIKNINDYLNKLSEETDYENPLYIFCDNCGKRVHLNETANVGIVYLGGITFDYEKIICDDCYCIGTCDVCGEYVGEDNLECVDVDDTYDCVNMCEYCKGNNNGK